MWPRGNGGKKFLDGTRVPLFAPHPGLGLGDGCVIAQGVPMPSGRRYRQYAEECLRDAQGATPVQRAHLLRVARTWFEIADQTETWKGDEEGLARVRGIKQ